MSASGCLSRLGELRTAIVAIRSTISPGSTCLSAYGIPACLAPKWRALPNCAVRVPQPLPNAVSSLKNTSVPWNSVCRQWSSTWPRYNKRLLALKRSKPNATLRLMPFTLLNKAKHLSVPAIQRQKNYKRRHTNNGHSDHSLGELHTPPPFHPSPYATPDTPPQPPRLHPAHT